MYYIQTTLNVLLSVHVLINLKIYEGLKNVKNFCLINIIEIFKEFEEKFSKKFAHTTMWEKK